MDLCPVGGKTGHNGSQCRSFDGKINYYAKSLSIEAIDWHWQVHFLGGHNFWGSYFRHSVKLQQLYKLLIFPFVDGSSNVSSICICTWHVVYIYLFIFTIHIICLYIYIYRYISGDLRDTRKDMPAIYNDFCQPHPTYFFCQFSLIN